MGNAKRMLVYCVIKKKQKTEIPSKNLVTAKFLLVSVFDILFITIPVWFMTSCVCLPELKYRMPFLAPSLMMGFFNSKNA